MSAAVRLNGTDNDLLRSIGSSLLDSNDQLGSLLSTQERGSSLYLSIARGLVPGIAIANAIGLNPDLDTGTVPEDVWIPGGSLSWLSAASALEIVSTSASDDAAGVGARTALVSGLDADYNTKSQAVSLSGITPVALSGTWLRINDLRIMTVGSSEQNVGDVIVRVAGSGATQSQCAAGAGRAQQTIFTIPNGKTAYVTFSAVGCHRATGADFVQFEYRTRSPGQSWITRNVVSVMTQGSNWVEVSPTVPVPFFQKTDFVVRATATGASNFVVTAQVQFLMIDN